MPTLWHRFAEDSALPSRLSNSDKEALAVIFNAADSKSMWCRALRAIGLPPINIPNGLLKWCGDVPYINWNAMVYVVSGGSLVPEPKGDQFTHRYCYNVSTIWGMVRTQWRISRYVQDHLSTKMLLPDTNDEKLVESLALGFCILALTMRIPSALLQGGLANKASIPRPFRKVIAQITALQHRRNQLSPAWTAVFKTQEDDEISDHAPEFFWDKPPAVNASLKVQDGSAHAPQTTLPVHWQGIPIAGESITGRAFLVRSKADAEMVKNSNERLVLIFPMARPETTELFSYAAAVLYAQGGSLSHAASIAREQNLPSITGLGKGFIAEIAQHLAYQPSLMVRVDPPMRSVKCNLALEI